MDHVLYFVAKNENGSFGSRATPTDADGRSSPALRAANLRLSVEMSPTRALMRLRSALPYALVVDARGERGDVGNSAAITLLRQVFDEHEVASVVPRERTWLLLDNDPSAAARAFEAGKMRLAGVFSPSENDAPIERVFQNIASFRTARPGRVALCLAGGGTEGLFYEVGALRALQHFLPNYDIAKVDILCGISAGAVLAGFLANGVELEECSRAFGGGKGRLEAIGRRELFDLDVSGFTGRAMAQSVDVLRRRRSPLSALFRVPPAGLFAGRRLREWLKRQLNAPGMTDSFTELDRKLFIGATDQDSNQHVVFGTPGYTNVPIHRAIRASAALAPFYAPEKIGGRYYVDGGFTRTTNMRVAVEEGATMVILVDPLVPSFSPRPGHVAERGAVFVAMQGLKSLINGRFDKAVPTLRAMYPHVAFHLFQPGEESRRVMGGSPMKYFYRQEIEEIAYRETVREIRMSRSAPLMRDFARHGIRFVDPDEVPASSRPEPEEIRVVA